MAEEYRIVAQPIVARLDQHTGKVVEGREIDFIDAHTGQLGRVFVAHDDYNAGNVQAAIRAQLSHIRDVHSLTD